MMREEFTDEDEEDLVIKTLDVLRVRQVSGFERGSERERVVQSTVQNIFNMLCYYEKWTVTVIKHCTHL